MTASKPPDEGTPMFKDARTHYDGCEDAHHDCCLVKFKAERQRCEELTLARQQNRGYIEQLQQRALARPR